MPSHQQPKQPDNQHARRHLLAAMLAAFGLLMLAMFGGPLFAAPLGALGALSLIAGVSFAASFTFTLLEHAAIALLPDAAMGQASSQPYLLRGLNVGKKFFASAALLATAAAFLPTSGLFLAMAETLRNSFLMSLFAGAFVAFADNLPRFVGRDVEHDVVPMQRVGGPTGRGEKATKDQQTKQPTFDAPSYGGDKTKTRKASLSEESKALLEAFDDDDLQDTKDLSAQAKQEHQQQQSAQPSKQAECQYRPPMPGRGKPTQKNN